MNLESKYRLGEELGQGATARVFSAQDKILERQVAIKIMQANSGTAEVEHLTARFLQEGKTLAALSHPHIPHVVEIGEWQSAPAIVMELVRGQALFSYIQNQPDTKDIVLHMAQIADALHYAHSQGVIHRDIKPDNILIAHSGAKLMDFGVARQEESVLKTSDGTMLGTIAYMAPEQLYNSAKVDARCDLYSFGVLLYELFTGQLPFDGTSPASVILQIFNTEAKSPDEINPHLPVSLSELIVSCIQKDANERIQTAKQIYYRLKEIALELGEKERVAVDITQTQPGVLLRMSQPMNGPRKTLGELEGLRISKEKQNLSLNLTLSPDGQFNEFALFLALDQAIEEEFSGAIKVKSKHDSNQSFWFKGVIWLQDGVIQHAQLIRDPQDSQADLKTLLSTPHGQVQRTENTPSPQTTLAGLDSRQLLQKLAKEFGFSWNTEYKQISKGSISYLYQASEQNRSGVMQA